jgi:ABC-type antimicrobial peptide transport system permease subunit
MVRGTSGTLTMLLTALAGLSLLVGGVVLMNILLISVGERTAEIGLRRAVGATRRDIFTQFLTESLSVTFLGMILGSALGWGVSLAIRLHTDAGRDFLGTAGAGDRLRPADRHLLRCPTGSTRRAPASGGSVAMKWSKSLGLSVEILAAHKLRTLLSILGIVVGVAAVILMVAAGKGAEQRILDRIRDMGTNLVTVNAGQTRIIAGRQRQISNVTTLIVEDAAAIVEQCPSVARAAAAVEKRFSARWESENANTTVLGIDPEGFAIRNITVAAGRIFDADECRGRRRVAVIGPTARKNLFPEHRPDRPDVPHRADPVRGDRRHRVQGVDANGLDQDDLVIVPLGTAMRRLMNVDHVQAIYVQAKSSDLLDEAEAEIRTLLRERHRLGDQPDDFTIQNQATCWPPNERRRKR